MPGMTTDTMTTEERTIYEWNRDFLLRIGVSPVAASAKADEVDPHEVDALVKRGCDPDVALDIVR